MSYLKWRCLSNSVYVGKRGFNGRVCNRYRRHSTNTFVWSYFKHSQLTLRRGRNLDSLQFTPCSDEHCLLSIEMHLLTPFPISALHRYAQLIMALKVLEKAEVPVRPAADPLVSPEKTNTLDMLSPMKICPKNALIKPHRKRTARNNCHTSAGEAGLAHSERRRSVELVEREVRRAISVGRAVCVRVCGNSKKSS